MTDWRKIIVAAETPLSDTIRRVDETGLQIALVVDGDGRLRGVVTDGDIRRAVLRGVALSAPTREVMNSNPITLAESASRNQILAVMRRRSVRQLPVLDSEGRLVGLESLDALIGAVDHPNAVVLMAGGLGTRLRPLTDTCPKPMIPVGGKPILERIIDSFIGEGFRRFYISVNYLSEAITDYFGDGSAWGAQIEYLHETQRLGTAGSLSLLPNRPEHPFFVMNGDLLTQANFFRMLDFHEAGQSLATMAVREYDIQIPYGVVRLDGARITGIDEKPRETYFVNAGIYVLDPAALDIIPANTYYDMPTLFGALNDTGGTTAYPLREYWLDIGRHEELERAHAEWSSRESS